MHLEIKNPRNQNNKSKPSNTDDFNLAFQKIHSRLIRRTGHSLNWFYPSLIAIVTILYSLLYLNTMPVSEGWGIFYVEQLFQGKVPYRDFYYYLPPLNLLIDTIHWKLSFGYLIVYRAYWLLQRVVIRVLVYCLLEKCFPKTCVFFASLLSIFITTANVYDLLGDYNQTSALLGVLIGFFSVGFVQTEVYKEKRRNIFWAGFVLGLMFLTKQTIFLAAGIIHFFALVAYCVCRKEKKTKVYFICVIAGMMIPILIAFLYLALNNGLIPFFEQVFFNTDGKGNIFTILFSGLISEIKKRKLLSFIMILSTLYYIVIQEERNGTMTLQKYIIVGAAELSLLNAFYHDEIKSVISSLITLFRVSKYAVVLLAILIIEILFCVEYYRRKKRDKRIFIPITGVFTFEIFLFTALSDTFSSSLYNSGLFSLIGTDLYTMFFFSGIAIAVYLIAKEKKNVINCPQFYILCAACSIHYQGLMSAVTAGAGYHGFFLLIPFVLCFAFEKSLIHSKYARSIGFCIYLVILLSCCIVISGKIWCSYAWWGTTDEPLSTKIYTSDIKALKGVRLSYNQKQLYDEIVDVIKQNSDNDDTIFCYPHMKIFNVLCNNFNFDTFVPVVFYDVAADKYIEEETNLLKFNLPDIVVWEEIEFCKETHETIFRNGKLLKQREMEKLFYCKFDTDYKLLKTIGNFSVYVKVHN